MRTSTLPVTIAMLVLAVVGIGEGVRLGVGDLFQPGPGMFPVVASLCLAGLGAALPVVERRRPPAPPDADEGEEPPLRWKVASYMGAILFYAVSLPWLGYLLSTALVVGFVLLCIERLGWRPSLAITIVTLAGSYLLFQRFLQVPLPRGRLL